MIKNIEKYAQMKRFYQDHQLQIYMYDFVYAHITHAILNILKMLKGVWMQWDYQFKIKILIEKHAPQNGLFFINFVAFTGKHVYSVV